VGPVIGSAYYLTALWPYITIIDLVYIEYLIRVLTSNFLLNYLNFGDVYMICVFN